MQEVATPVDFDAFKKCVENWSQVDQVPDVASEAQNQVRRQEADLMWDEIATSAALAVLNAQADEQAPLIHTLSIIVAAFVGAHSPRHTAFLELMAAQIALRAGKRLAKKPDQQTEEILRQARKNADMCLAIGLG